MRARGTLRRAHREAGGAALIRCLWGGRVGELIVIVIVIHVQTEGPAAACGWGWAAQRSRAEAAGDRRAFRGGCVRGWLARGSGCREKPFQGGPPVRRRAGAGGAAGAVGRRVPEGGRLPRRAGTRFLHECVATRSRIRSMRKPEARHAHHVSGAEDERDGAQRLLRVRAAAAGTKRKWSELERERELKDARARGAAAGPASSRR